MATTYYGMLPDRMPQRVEDLDPAMQARCITAAAAHQQGLRWDFPELSPGQNAPIAIIVDRDQVASAEYRGRPAWNWWQVETGLHAGTVAVLI